MATTAEKLAALEAQLVEVNASISQVLKAQAAGHGAANVQRATLDSQRAWRRELKAEIATLSGQKPRAATCDFSK